MNAYIIYVYYETEWTKYLVFDENKAKAVLGLIKEYDLKDYKRIEAYPTNNDAYHFMASGEYQS